MPENSMSLLQSDPSRFRLSSFMLKALDNEKLLSILGENKDDFIGKKEKELLYCASCFEFITSGDQRIRIDENHEYRFSNPAGFVFKIGCFKSAPGIMSQGKATDDFTWFKGFFWRMAHCGGCANHIGWEYTREDHSGFFGLILNRLTNKKTNSDY